MLTPVEIISLAETVVKVGLKIYTFLNSLKDAPQEIRDLCTEIESLRDILVDIGISTSDLFTASMNGKSLGPETILISLKACESELNTLWLTISSLCMKPGLEWKEVLKKLSKSVSWVVNAGDIGKVVERLSRQKQTLALAMILSGMKTNKAILETLAFIGGRIEENNTVLVSQLVKFEDALLLKLAQVENQLLQRVNDLSGVAASQHIESDRRIEVFSENMSHAPSLQSVNHEASHLSHIPTSHDNLSSTVARPESGAGTHSFAPDNDRGYERFDEKPEELIKVTFNEAMSTWKATLPKNDINPSFNCFALSSIEALGSQNVDPFESLVWKWMLLILRVALGFFEMSSELESMIEILLEEIDSAFETCAREYVLYPEPRVKDLVVALYGESLSGIFILFKAWKENLAQRNYFLTQDYNKVLKRTVQKIKASSEKITKEVEYLHRRELREAHTRLRTLDRKQDEVIRALEEQKRMLLCMKEEQQMLALVADHQKVLQMIQQLLARFPTSPELLAASPEVAELGIKGISGVSGT